jgi:Ca2+-binding EF-hand superfamily protein
MSRPLRGSHDSAMETVAKSAVAQGSTAGGAWEEPVDAAGGARPSVAVIDRCESMLRSALERSKEYKKLENNPILAVQSLFQRLDKNHSGKITNAELKELCRGLEFEANANTLKALFARFDLDQSGSITLQEFATALFKLDGGSEFKAKSAIARMREVLALRAGGFESIRAMGSQFRIMDRDRSGELSKDEFKIALDTLFSHYDVKFSTAEKNALFQLFDFDKSNKVNYDEFARGIRGDMNDFRLGWVKQAFSILDKDGSGVVETAEIAKTYDVSQNPAVQSGKVTPQQAIQQFMKQYDANADGNVTLEEFVENYQWVSASIDADDYFELMMRNAWHISGGEGWCENTSNLRVLVVHADGRDEVVEVKNDLGLPRDPAEKTSEVVRRLGKQGVKDIKRVEFFG